MPVVLVVHVALELQGHELAREPRTRASAVDEGGPVDVVCRAARVMLPKLVVIFGAAIRTTKAGGPGAGQAQANSFCTPLCLSHWV